ncbi:flavin reductase (DIM6/NTAB) family NADH-FMN oxidoreductase RutF [Agrobacterium larrymoorei]|uniref:Flavin reductase (DIM6/NTAB) family NADH-FMN oxidoreductase RutF n=1 Tax=Agrobacterium larrymoorei TaxID=160699 RepID=A0AAJ2B9W0_9HYPH|nr:flavin reductase (DIM6/NTAB) family NADH-FMN oxidoreductase RutF [Agrobacterium larrymoorei]
MFYTTDTNQHGMAHDPFKAIVAPRPIGWIGSKGSDGTLNLSPYSFFNAIADKPKLVLFLIERTEGQPAQRAGNRCLYRQSRKPPSR